MRRDENLFCFTEALRPHGEVTMSDIVERLRIYVSDEDHKRGCRGREYDCSCGYDGKRDQLLTDAVDTITRFRNALNADPQTLRLHLGEMTAQEMRTLKAGFHWVLNRAALAQGGDA